MLKNVPLIEKNNELNFWEGNRKASLDFAAQFAPNKRFAEFGVYQGACVPWMLEYADELFLFDSFEGLPEDWFGKFKRGMFKTEIPRFDDPRITLVAGLFENTIEKYRDHDFGLIHLDADLYSSTKTVLQGLNIQSGTILVFDEFYNLRASEQHEQKAFLEWIGDRKYEILGRTAYSQVIIRV